MKSIPTDYDILSEIYRRYYDTFCDFGKDAPKRRTKIYVPISVVDIAQHFGVDPDIIFGRLYYHLDRKFGYSHDDKTKVQFFTTSEGLDKHSIQFPLLSSVLADMIEQRRKHAWTFRFSVIAMIVSCSSLLLTGLKFLHDWRATDPEAKVQQSAPKEPEPPKQKQ